MRRKRLTDEQKARAKRRRVNAFILALIVSSVLFIIYRSPIISSIGFVSAIFLLILYFYFADGFRRSSRIHRMEMVFPDFLQLVSSNLRAGMTIDRSMMLSARPEFAPLDEEITQTGKDITTGMNIERALKNLGERIDSDKIKKTILIILSGIRAGGDLAVLLDQTAVNMRQREFVQKKAASQVLMYVIFIFFAVAVFAPGLFALSNILVETMNNLVGSFGAGDIQSSGMITFSKLSISLNFIKYYSIIFIITSDILASLVIGLVNKGEEREGLKLFPVILGLSIGIFFGVRYAISGVMGGLLGG